MAYSYGFVTIIHTRVGNVNVHSCGHIVYSEHVTAVYSIGHMIVLAKITIPWLQ